jgi:hypothetical protein
MKMLTIMATSSVLALAGCASFLDARPLLDAPGEPAEAITPAAYVPAVDVPPPATPEYRPEVCPPPPGKCHCGIVWLRPWKCEDLEMKPVEPGKKFVDCKCSWWKNFLWCVPEEEEKEEEKEEAKDEEKKENGDAEKKNGNGNGDKKNGNGEKKNGNGEKQNGEKKDAKGEGDMTEVKDEKAEAKKKEEEEAKKKEEEELNKQLEEERAPIMQSIFCFCPCKYEQMKKRGDNIYGWVQMGYTANPDSPADGINFGVNFNNRANYYQFNQGYLVFENLLDVKPGEWDYGYRLDVITGTDAPFLAAFGLFDNVVNTADKGQNIGFDLPQFYGEVHLPYLTCNGVDIRIGKFYTPAGCEFSPAIQTNFYSHSYSFNYGPFTHTGIWGTVRLTDTVNQSFGIVRGWDVFEDNNDKLSYMGQTLWTSCDKRHSAYVTGITGPEQPDNNVNYRTLICADYFGKFGCCNQYQVILEALYGYESNAPVPLTANPTGFEDSSWYGTNATFLYTLDPRVILGCRAEWYGDPNGTRTGFENNYYEFTAGVTFKPYKNLRIRPEARFDYADQTPVYDDLTKKRQCTAAVDLIWEF